MTFTSFFTCTLLVFLAQQLGAQACATGASPGMGSSIGGTKGAMTGTGFTGTAGAGGVAAPLGCHEANTPHIGSHSRMGQKDCLALSSHGLKHLQATDARGPSWRTSAATDIFQVFLGPSCAFVTGPSPVLPLVKHGFRVCTSRFSTVTFSTLV